MEKIKIHIYMVFRYSILIIAAVTALFPILYVVINSFLSPSEAQATYESVSGSYVKLKLVPDMVTLEQYYQAFFRSPRYLELFWNSVVITVPIVAGQVVFCSLAAYAFAKLEFPGRDKIFVVFIILLTLPPQSSLVANYIMLDRMKLVGNYLSILLPGIFSAFGVCLLRQYMRYIPNECMEAARIDGAGRFRTFWNILLPQAKGGIGTLIILSFIDNWNMIEQPLILLKDASKYPMSVVLSNMQVNSGVFAFAIIFMIPPLIIYLIFEKDFVKGFKL